MTPLEQAFHTLGEKYFALMQAQGALTVAQQYELHAELAQALGQADAKAKEEAA